MSIFSKKESESEYYYCEKCGTACFKHRRCLCTLYVFTDIDVVKYMIKHWPTLNYALEEGSYTGGIVLEFKEGIPSSSHKEIAKDRLFIEGKFAQILSREATNLMAEHIADQKDKARKKVLDEMADKEIAKRKKKGENK
jgi:hypothetical protein